MSVEDLINKICCLQDVMESQIPVETAVVFGEYQDQPMRSTWADDELQTIKNKMIELIKKL
jgi:hypothetical protein